MKNIDITIKQTTMKISKSDSNKEQLKSINRPKTEYDSNILEHEGNFLGNIINQENLNTVLTILSIGMEIIKKVRI